MRTARHTLLALALTACGPTADSTPTDAPTDAAASVADASQFRPDASTPQYPELWYSVDDRLVYIQLDPQDGSVVQILDSTMGGVLPLGYNALTMLEDGSLIGSRLSKADGKTYFYHIKTLSRDGSPVSPELLGIMPDNIKLEGLFTDCDGRLYAMDTGTDVANSDGNRLLRFTESYLAGSFDYVVVSDLDEAVVADIDDMSPGIKDNKITDNPGLAIDTSEVYDFNYELGTGSLAGQGGTYGIHALGGPVFSDGISRLYVLNELAELFEMDPETYSVSAALATGPTDVPGMPGLSGLAGPLTDCDSGFEP